MDKLLQDFAEFIGREWARRWLEQLRRSQEEQTAGDETNQTHVGRAEEQGEPTGEHN